ncbi:DMT family transporter [Nocardiopsis alba]|uniref:DMT family transporter n=1 Tax=Nocardiopsis alba TaxID=53437 RepID=UPI0018FEE329|nr:DMT family transporter [Nocardiopsis alba]
MSVSRAAATASYMFLGLVWGTSFLFMSWSTDLISPAQTTLLRVVFGLVPVALFATFTRAWAWWHLRHAHHLVVMSLLATSVYYLAFAAGTARLDSGVAGALSGSIPLFALIAALVLVPGEGLTARKGVGLALGTGGVVLLARPWAAGAVDAQGVVLMLAGAASLGASFAYARRFVIPLGIPSAAATGYQLALAALGLVLITDMEGIGHITQDTTALVGVVVGLGGLGTGAAFILYYVAVAGLGAVTASTATFLPPAVAMALGALVMGETVRADGIVALALILLAALVTRPGPRTHPSGTRGIDSSNAKESPRVRT